MNQFRFSMLQKLELAEWHDIIFEQSNELFLPEFKIDLGECSQCTVKKIWRITFVKEIVFLENHIQIPGSDQLSNLSNILVNGRILNINASSNLSEVQ